MSDAAELSPGRTLWEALGDIPDRRGAKGRRYPLRSVLTLSLAAMLAGGNDLCSIFRWGRRLPPEALYLLGLKRAPCHAMYHYFYEALDVAATEQAFSGPAEQARDRGGRQAPGRVRQGARDHVRDEQAPRPAPEVKGPTSRARPAGRRARMRTSFRHGGWEHTRVPSEDVVLLEARLSMLVGEDAAVVECKRLNHCDCLFRERACTEQRGQHNLLNGQGRPWIKVIQLVGQFGLVHLRLRAL